jgi:hypothetical protein
MEIEGTTFGANHYRGRPTASPGQIKIGQPRHSEAVHEWSSGGS